MTTDEARRVMRAIAFGEHEERRLVVEWLRSDDGEKCRIQAEDSAIPPEDALAHEIERGAHAGR